MKLRPTASWRTSTWPGFGSGTGRSTTSRTSGPPASRALTASMSEGLFEEVERAALGQRRVGGVVVLPARPREGVVAAGVGEKRHLRVVLQARGDHLLGGPRHELVLLGDVQQERLGQLLGLAKAVFDAD